MSAMKEITLTQNKIALVDDEDYALVSQFKWHACYDKSKDGWYARSSRGKGPPGLVNMHRLIMQPGQLEVDHVNGDSLDNRRSNLRLCTRRQNSMNQKNHKNSTSKYKGVSWYTRENCWRAAITVYGNYKLLGYFDNEKEAAQAYRVAAQKYFGEYALRDEYTFNDLMYGSED